MGYEKAEIIKGVYDEQARDAIELAATSKRESHEHDGAAQALAQMGKQMPNFAARIEERIAADTEMSPSESNVARVYAKNMIAQFQTMCLDNAKNQINSKLRCEGQISLLEKQRDTAIKKGDLAISKAVRRAELEKEAEAKAAEEAKDAKKKTPAKPAKKPAKKKAAKKTPADKERFAKIAAAAKRTKK